MDARRLARARVRTLPVRSAAAALLVLIAGVTLSPGGLGRALVALARPGTVRSQGLTIRVEPGDVSVRAGTPVRVAARVTSGRTGLLARGGEAAVLWVRPRGGDWATVPMHAAARASDHGSFAATLERVDQDVVYHVTYGGEASRDFAVHVLADPGLVGVRVTYDYPSYSRLPSETVDQTTGDLAGLAGTVAEVTYRLSAPVEDARLVFENGSGASALTVRDGGRELRGRVRVLSPTRYRIVGTPRGAAGAAAGAVAGPFAISPSPDAPPVVRLLAPEAESQMPREMQVGLVTEAADDFGLSSLSLVSWREGSAARTRRALAAPRGREDRRQSAWDLRALGLAPGQTLLYYVEAADNNGVRGPQVARTEVHRIVFPTLGQIYAQASDEHKQTAEDLTELLDKGRSLQKQLEAEARSARSKQMSWEDKKALERAVEEQRRIAETLEKTSEDLAKTLDKLEERSQMSDELLRKVAEIQNMIRNLANEELKRALERLAQAIKQVDPNEVKAALSQLQVSQEQLLKGLDRTIELLKKIQREERLESLARSMEELAAQQKQLAAEMKAASSEAQKQEAAARQGELARQAADAQKEAQSLSQEMKQDEPQTAEQLEQAGEQMEKSGVQSTMERAAELMKKGDRNSASREGQKAQQQLSQLSKSLRDAQQAMSEAQRRALAQAMEGMARDMLALSQREEGLSSGTQARTTTELAQEQSVLHDEAERVADRMWELGRKTPFINQELGRSMGDALRSTQESTTGFERGNRGLGERKAKDASTALNMSVMQLLQAKESACNGGTGGGSQSAKSLMQRLSALGQMQSQLNAETEKMMGSGSRLSPSAQGQLARMAAQQEMIRQGLSELAREASQTQSQLGRLGSAAEEMRQVERELAANRLTPETVERQHKILSRLLEAQRAVEKRDADRERTAQSGIDVTGPSPGPIPAAALTDKDRLTIDLLRAKADPVPPEYRRLIDAYFRALTGSSPR